MYFRISNKNIDNTHTLITKRRSACSRAIVRIFHDARTQVCVFFQILFLFSVNNNNILASVSNNNIEKQHATFPQAHIQFANQCPHTHTKIHKHTRINICTHIHAQAEPMFKRDIITDPSPPPPFPIHAHAQPQTPHALTLFFPPIKLKNLILTYLLFFMFIDKASICLCTATVQRSSSSKRLPMRCLWMAR